MIAGLVALAVLAVVTASPTFAQAPTSAHIQAVPEPATLLLIGIGLAIVAYKSRRRRG